MKISEINDKVIIQISFNFFNNTSNYKQKQLEDSPHETISQLCIGDFLYGNLDNPNDVSTI